MLSMKKYDDYPENSSFGKLEKAWKKLVHRKSKHRIVLVKRFCRYIPEISFDTRLWRRYLVGTLVVMATISFVFEWRRLYLEQVAKKQAASIAGMPLSCLGDSLSWDGIKSILRWQLSWSHDPCEKYHHAVLVDAFWEVNPFMVVVSLIARTLVHPMEILASGFSQSTRNLFSEIPAQWQLIFFLFFFVVVVISLLGYFGFKISIPFVLSIETGGHAQRQDNQSANKKRL